mmetsp:Transcript_13750/g.39113  ORF Transcript_13750/g.39113 Transcript_13750/m.39113 type:complete len:661 (-) Transcript_13750:66-2048(-)
MAVVNALAESIPINECDELGEAAVLIYESHGKVMQLLKKLIHDEVEQSEDPATLFRGNCIASKFMKAYSKLIGIPYLADTLQDLIDQVLANVGSYEVDPRKLEEGQNMDENWVRLMEAGQNCLDAITESLDACPMEFRELSLYLLEEVQKKYPDYKNAVTFVGGFIFLRFFCPAMVAPEGYRLVDDVPSLAERRGLILVSKGIQNLSNGVQFGAKEAFMMPMNEFIIRNLHQTRQFLEQVASLPEADPIGEEARDALREEITTEMKEEALESAHRLLYINQQAVVELLQEGSEDVEHEDLEKPLEEFNRLVELGESDWKEMSNIIVQNPAIIQAFCSSIQTAEVAQSLITIFEANNCTLNVLRDLIVLEAQESKSNPNMILRGNGTAFKMLRGYVEIIGLFYLQQTLGMVVKFVCNNPEGFEIDISRCEPGTTEEDIEENAQKLTDAFNEFWSQITTSVDMMPMQIRVLCKHLFEQIAEVCPEKRYSVTGDFIFNRMLGPAIVAPVSYGLMDEEPTEAGRRALILITKVILNTVHGIQIYQKEPYLNVMSHIVVECADSFQAFIDEVINVDSDATSNMSQGFEITPDLLEESVLTVSRQLQEDRTRGHVAALLTPDDRETGSVADRLQALLKDLGLPARKRNAQTKAGPQGRYQRVGAAN